MWKILLLLICVNYSGLYGAIQVFEENWKNEKLVPENTDDADFVRKNETNLEGIPKFLQQPEKLYYVYEGKSARITCIAEPVSHVNIICNKFVYSYMEKEISESKLRVQKMNKNNQLDSHGDRWRFSFDVTFNQVTEFYDTFSCVCEAWNQLPVLGQAKKIHSTYGIFKDAYLKDQFIKWPQSRNIQKGQSLQLSCEPPDSKPKPSLEWWKDGKKLLNTDRIKIINDNQLLITEAFISDSGNYSCVASIMDQRRYSPTAIVKVREHLWNDWSKWSKCDGSCRRIRTRTCYQKGACKGATEQIELCRGSCEVITESPFATNRGGKGVSPPYHQDAKDVAIYVGLFVAVTVLVMIVTVVFCLLRRKSLIPLRSSMRYPISGSGLDYNTKNNFATGMLDSKIVTIKNQNAVLLQQRSFHSSSPKNPPHPTYITDIGSNNAYSTGVDISYNSNGSGHFSQPLISNSSLGSTTNKSKTTTSSNTDVKVFPITTTESPITSRPTSALYHELSLDDVCAPNSPLPFVSDNIDVSTITWAHIGSGGGRLCLPQSGISLTVMNNSFISSSSNEMYLAVSRNDPGPPILSDSETLLSPIVLFGPSNIQILKPCVLSIPHSADLKQGNWIIRVMSCSSTSQFESLDSVPSPTVWKNIATIGCETDQVPIYTHLDPYSAHILTDRCQKLCLIGQSYPGGKATKRLRLAAFGRPLSLNPYLPNYNIRIYVFSDTKEAFESVSSIEMKMGSTLLDNTHQIIFSDGMGNLFFCIEELSTGWRNQLTAKYQEIPFQDIWSGSQSETLHCAFTFDSVDQSQQAIMCRITAYQSGFYNHKQTITIKQDKLDRSHPRRDLIQHEKILLHSETNNTYLDPLMTVFRISVPTKKRLCMLLDNITSRGNDWRQLARQLNLNGYINYFLSKVSPTETILTLWEARNRSEAALPDLINCFKAIGRIDCATILESDNLSS